MLILDEPTAGLDPLVQNDFVEALRELRRRGRTIFFSSHVLSEVEGLCDRVAVLREGRIILDAPVGHLLDRSTRPGRVYRHTWEVGDTVIWDNRGVLHRACEYDPSSPRDMHRCTLAGDEPIQ